MPSNAQNHVRGHLHATPSYPSQTQTTHPTRHRQGTTNKPGASHGTGPPCPPHIHQPARGRLILRLPCSRRRNPARLRPTGDMQPIRCDSTVKNVALDTLFLIVLQAAVVIALGKFIHLGLRRHNLPSATSQILVRGSNRPMRTRMRGRRRRR